MKFEFERLAPYVMATFRLPTMKPPDDLSGIMQLTDPDLKSAEALFAIPFPCVKICARHEFTYETDPYWSTVENEVILTDQGGVKGPHKSRITNGRMRGEWRVLYFPEHSVEMYGEFLTPGKRVVLGENYVSKDVLAFILALDNSRAAITERPYSRQERRHEGLLNPIVYSYTVRIRAAGERLDAGEHTVAKMEHRSPILHAVRSHLRHLSSGKVTKVRAHARGKGSMLQVKDYAIPSYAVPDTIAP